MPQIPESVNSSQNSPCDEEADKEDEGQEGGKPPFVPNRPPSEPPFPPSEEPLHNGFEPSDRPFDAGTPAFPLGFPSPAADSSECPPESPAAATPPESPSHHTPHPHTRPSAASAPAPSRSSSPASPPAPPQTDDDRAHSQAPPPHSREAHLHSLKRAFSSLSASYAHLFLPLPPFFRLHQRGIDRHRLHLHLPQRIPPVQKDWRNLSPDSLLLEFGKPPSGRRIGAICARPIAPPAAGDPHIQNPVEDLAVLHPRSSGFGPGRPQGRNESPRFIGQPLKPHRSSPPRQAGRRQRILQPDTRFLRRVPCRIPRLRGDAGVP